MKLCTPLCLLLVGLASAQVQQIEERSLDSVGEGLLPVPADGLRLLIKIEAVNTTVAEAKETVSATLDDLNDLKDAFGIDVNATSGSSETKSLTVRKNWTWRNNGNREQDGFIVTQEMEIKMYDLDLASTVVEALTDQEGLEIDEVRLIVKETQRHEIRALQLAVKDAVVKAQALANVLGMAIGFPRKVDSSPTESNGPIFPRTMMDSAKMSAEVGSIGEAWRKGTVDFSARVRIKFDLLEIY